ncbi:hypothetical protein ACROYT_G042789 [Oculina patagonica]
MTGRDILSVFTRLTLFATGIAVCLASPGNVAPKARDNRSPVFLQTPRFIHHYVTRNQSANLTWVAKNVCKIQIKCNGRKFQDGLTRVCGKSCRNCRTRKKTKIVTVADFPKNTRSITCQCKVWGKIAVRSDKIIIEKAFLRRNFGAVQSYRVVTPNTTVVLQCRPPVGSPRPNITWHKIGKPLFLLGSGRRVRLRSKKDLVIKRVRMGDSGEYWCVARNMAARRVGPVMKLDVRENISIPVCNENQWPCTSQSKPECKNKSNTSTCDSEPPMLMVGTQNGLYTTDLVNTSKSRRVGANNIVSLDFGLDPNLVYWSDGKKINLFSIHNGVSKEMPFRHDDVSSVEGLAVDWIGDKLYWIDAMHWRSTIYIGDLRSGRKVKIIEKNLDSPRAIVVSHSAGYIYWTDWGRTPKIERARLDGTERKVVITSGIQIPNGLALDESDNKLYWAGTDANEYGIIEAVALDGLNRTVIFYRSGYLPFGLDTFQDIVYWSDWEKGAVLRINKTDGGGEEVLVSGLNQPMGLKILHRHKEKKGVNPCDKGNGECEYLCVYLPFLGRRRCFCEENFKLNENGKTCEKVEFRGESRNKSSPNTPAEPSLVVILLISILLLVVGLVIFLIKKRCPCQMTQDLPRMTSPDDIEDDEESLELTDQTELGRTVQHVNSEPAEPSNLIGQESSEPSGSAAARENSLVTSPRGVVVYVTKVEVEQHGGVTVVGDDAKVHHHYSPQS